MIDNLKRIREPLTWAVIAVVAANIVVGMIHLVVQLQQSTPVYEAFQEIGSSLMNLTLVVIVVALVCTCFFIAPATRHALTVTRAAAGVLTVGVVLTLVCSAMGVAASANPVGVAFEIVGTLLDLILKALAAGVLWVLMRGVDAGRIDTAAPAALPEPAAVEPEVVEDVPTVWQRSEATGAVWRTADEAATGVRGANRLPASETPAAGGIFRDEAETQGPSDSRS
ncbi:MAG TPA: hypothetical protein VGK18_03590 [Propionicimonas sp.]|jgi:hypothetical protein|uniref:hypothetical protein n=1 Tax=Propionicimonas sp. TaxID=1955623 RepID=UPI002F404553